MPAWFRTSTAWQGFCAEIANAASDEVNEVVIHFEGHEYGYRDLVNFFNYFNRKRKNRIWFSVIAPRTFCYDDNDALAHLAELNDKNTTALPQTPEREQALHAPTKRAMRVHEICTDGEFEIAVVAPMSCGKSTLLNALLRKELLPVGNMATTAKIVRIFDVDNAKGFTFTCEDADGHPLPLKGDATLRVCVKPMITKKFFMLTFLVMFRG